MCMLHKIKWTLKIWFYNWLPVINHMLHYFHHGNKNKRNGNGKNFLSNLVISVYFVNYLKLQVAEFLKEIFSFRLQFVKIETMYRKLFQPIL